MIIDTDREITKEEAKEYTSVLMNGAQLLTKPTEKISNVFGFCNKVVIFIVIEMLFFGFFWLKGDRDALVIAGLIFTFVCILFLIVFVIRVNQVYQSLLKRSGEHVIMTIDEKGIDYEVVGSQRFQTSWSNVSFVRICKKAAYIFPKEITGVIYCVSMEFVEELKTCLKECQSGIQIVE